MPRTEWSCRAAAAAGLIAITIVALGCMQARGKKASDPLRLTVTDVSKTASAQAIARTVAFGPNFEVIPQIESIEPKEGYSFVLFQLDATNSGDEPITIEGVKLSLERGGLFAEKSGVYYLLAGDKLQAAYMPIGDPGIQPKDEVKPGARVTWKLMTTVKSSTRKLELKHPGANPATFEF